MKIQVDDWHFQPPESEFLVVDLYLDNGQHALMEVHPLYYLRLRPSKLPEIIVHCEMPGEKLDEVPHLCRWIYRPPDRNCAWSRVEIPPVLLQQINYRIVMLAPDSASVN
jgi:hypothetical protein